MRYLALAVVALAAYIAGRFIERSWWMSDDDSYRSALIRRLLDSDVEIQILEDAA